MARGNNIVMTAQYMEFFLLLDTPYRALHENHEISSNTCLWAQQRELILTLHQGVLAVVMLFRASTSQSPVPPVPKFGQPTCFDPKFLASKPRCAPVDQCWGMPGTGGRLWAKIIPANLLNFVTPRSTCILRAHVPSPQARTRRICEETGR